MYFIFKDQSSKSKKRKRVSKSSGSITPSKDSAKVFISGYLIDCSLNLSLKLDSYNYGQRLKFYLMLSDLSFLQDISVTIQNL